MKSPLISVIIAVYNIEAYIEKCVDSLTHQTYSHLEIILVDDGSKDSSGKKCDELAKKDPRIKVIHRENGGLSAARNSGIAIATGDYLAFVDGDDWIDQDMYELMLSAALQFDAELVACRYRCIYVDEIIDRTTNRMLLFEGTEMLKAYLEEDESCVIQHAAWNKLYKKSLLGEERFPEGKLYEDVVFSAKMIGSICNGVYLDCAKYNYVINRPGSIMAQGLNPKMFTDLLPAYLEKEEYLREIGDESLVVLHQYHYLKKMVLWYRQIEEQKRVAPDVQFYDWQNTILQVFREHENAMENIYACPLCSKNDRIKFKFFIKHPHLFCSLMCVNDKTVLKIRLLLKKQKG